jgi:4-amino-4-deoxy-L-arabinose transferase-like glycosyltransferase
VAIITALGVPLIYLIARELFNQKNVEIFHETSLNFNKKIPLFTALVYLTLLPVVRHGRLAMMDGIIVTFFLISIYCLLKSKTNKIYGIGVGLGLGCIALTKGVLVLLLGFIIKLFVIVNKEYKLLKNVYLWLGIILGLMAVFSWYWLQYQQYGDTFINVHFKSQSFDRLSTAVEGNKGSIFYYVIELLKYTIPWLLFLPQGLILAWQNKKQSLG